MRFALQLFLWLSLFPRLVSVDAGLGLPPAVEASSDQMAMSALSGEVEGSAFSGQHLFRAPTPASSSFGEGANALSASDLELLSRFSDGAEVIEKLREEPWLVAPVLSTASRLVPAEATRLLPVVSALQAHAS